MNCGNFYQEVLLQLFRRIAVGRRISPHRKNLLDMRMPARRFGVKKRDPCYRFKVATKIEAFLKRTKAGPPNNPLQKGVEKSSHT